MSSVSTPEGSSEPPLFLRDFSVLLATQLAFGFAFSSFSLLPKYVVTDLHGSPSQVGYVGALAVVAAVVVSPFCGRLLDRGGRRAVIFGGCALSGLGAWSFLGVSRVDSYLYAMRALQGAGYTFYVVAAATLVADLSPSSRLSQALGWFGCAGLLMNAIATLVAERVAHNYGWSSVFALAGASGMLGAVLSLSLREPQRDNRGGAASVAQTPAAPSRLPILWGTAAGGAAFGVMSTFTQPLALAVGDTKMSPLFGGFTAAALLVRLFFGNLGDRFGRARIAAASLFLYTLVVAATAGLVRGRLGWVGVGLGLAHGAFYPAVNALALEGVAREARGRIGAHFNAAFNAGVLLVTLCLGHVAQSYGYRAVFLLVACLSASGCFALWRLRPWQ